MAVLFVVSAGTAKDPQAVSAWAETPLQIDGKPTEWGNDVLNQYKKYGVDYGFRNDANYFYILFMFTEPEYMSSIHQTGMTVYISIPDKKRKDYLIRFHQKQITAEEYIFLLENKQGPLSEEAKQKIQANPFYLNYSGDVGGKDAEKGGPVPADAPLAFYRPGQMENGVVYEIAIPLQRVSDAAPGLAAEIGSSVKIGFEWGGMTKEMRDQRMRQVVAGTARADSGGGGSFNPKSENAGGARESASIASMRRRSPKKYSFWVDVRLSGGK
jgi:hypothetical protein